MDEKLATAVTECTCIGGMGSYPYLRGNCFSVETDDGKNYRIVNFVLENLEHLLNNGLTWPVKIRVLAGRTAVVCDGRIAERAYQTDFCEICCPAELLPTPQRLRHLRDIERGLREESKNSIVTHLGRPSQIPIYGD